MYISLITQNVLDLAITKNSLYKKKVKVSLVHIGVYHKKSLRQSHHVQDLVTQVYKLSPPIILSRLYMRTCVHLCAASIDLQRRLLARRPPRRGMRICLREYCQAGTTARRGTGVRASLSGT